MHLTTTQTRFLEKHIHRFDTRQWRISAIARTGSARRFWRLQHAHEPRRRFILMQWDAGDPDWEVFCAVQRRLDGTGHYLVPRIEAADRRTGLVLQQDGGPHTLTDIAAAAGHTHGTCEETCEGTRDLYRLYCTAIDSLRLFHALDYTKEPALHGRCMDTAHFLWESDYFGTHFVSDVCGAGQCLDAGWQQQRRALAHRAAALPHVFMHRDCQSQNVVVECERVLFVDYQGARPGPAAYDIASLVYDPYVAPALVSLRPSLLAYARRCMPDLHDEALHICTLQRLMQALGAYANLSRNKHKPGYARYMYPALKQLYACARAGDDVPALVTICEVCLATLAPSRETSPPS
jgi:hypothetical protein